MLGNFSYLLFVSIGGLCWGDSVHLFSANYGLPVVCLVCWKDFTCLSFVIKG